MFGVMVILLLRRYKYHEKGIFLDKMMLLMKFIFIYAGIDV